ncbi:MAG: alpha/beta hydrolase, partial [Planctomycetota bacterium]
MGRRKHAFDEDIELNSKQSVIWKTEKGRDRLEDHYKRFLSKLGAGVGIRTVPTRIGSGQMLVMGPNDGTPILCLHAMRTGAPFLLSELIPLARTAKLYVPDLPGQSIHGIDVELPVNDDSFAKWVLDVMDFANLNRVGVFGVSWGGWVAQSFASLYPDRVNRIATLVPAGIVKGNTAMDLLKMVPRMIRYQLSPSRENLKRLFDRLVTTLDDDWMG